MDGKICDTSEIELGNKMKLKVLILGEPTRTMQPGLDTGVLIASEMLRRGHLVDYIDSERVDWRKENKLYFASLPFQRITKVTPNQPEPFELELPRKDNVLDYHVVWQRLDPPVDGRYKSHMGHFSKLPSRILQINNPEWNWKLSEHLLPQNYPGFAIPTWECGSLSEFVKCIRANTKESVVKPLHLYSGLGIEFFNTQTPESELMKYWEKWKPKVAVQPYIQEITTQGDLRILVMNKKVVGSVLRKPKSGSKLANLHQGGSAHFFEPTEKQLQACEVISNDLFEKGLYLLGIDFIGDFLTEVNITCPSALPQINQVMKIEGEKMIIDEMEALVRSR